MNGVNEWVKKRNKNEMVKTSKKKEEEERDIKIKPSILIWQISLFLHLHCAYLWSTFLLNLNRPQFFFYLFDGAVYDALSWIPSRLLLPKRLITLIS